MGPLRRLLRLEPRPESISRLIDEELALHLELRTAELVAEGAMSWDAPIVNQLPAFKLRDYTSAKHVTVRDVLSRRAGESQGRASKR